MRGGNVLWYGGVVLNRMSLGMAWSSIELCELVYDEPLRLLHTLSSDSVRYRERLGDKLPTADTWEKESNSSWEESKQPQKVGFWLFSSTGGEWEENITVQGQESITVFALRKRSLPWSYELTQWKTHFTCNNIHKIQSDTGTNTKSYGFFLFCDSDHLYLHSCGRFDHTLCFGWILVSLKQREITQDTAEEILKFHDRGQNFDRGSPVKTHKTTKTESIHHCCI